MKNKNNAALLRASQLKKEAALSRAWEALEQMEIHNIPINFQSLSRFAKVSKVWLYNQSDLCDRIKSARDQTDTVKRAKEIHSLIKIKDKEIDRLKLKLKQQNDKIVQLKKQLEIVYGELHKQNKDY